MTDEQTVRRMPRRSSRFKRPRRILGMWARLILSVAVIAASMFLAVCLVLKAVKPYREASRQTVQLAETEHQSSEIAAENVQLERRIAYLKTPDGAASEARRMGYLRPGEYPIVVEGLPEHSDWSQAPSAAPVFAPPQSSPMRRFWRHLSGH